MSVTVATAKGQVPSQPRSGTASLDERIAATRADLSPAELRVVEYIGREREEVAFLSAAEIARELATSDATVIRAAQSLGYAGLPELKAELQDALRSRATPVLRLGRSLEELGDDPVAILEHALANERQLVDDARASLRPAEFVRALEVLDQAERVVAFGIGPNGPHAQYLAIRLVRLRRRAVAVSARGAGLADALLDLRKGDVVVAIAYEQAAVEVRAMFERARELKLRVVLITDSLGLALGDRLTISLSARRAGSGMYHQSGITIVILDALLMALAARRRASSLDAARDLQRLRDRIAQAG